MRDVGLALVEEENRPGKGEVMNRSKCQKKRLLGRKFPDLGAAGLVVVHGDLAWVCVCLPHRRPPISVLSSWDIY